ncbi:ClpX C4-type zinc finger protein [Nocardia aurantia]|nr:ClpX C4-type zinc finger protein [Nocardia aurantia]
MSSTAHTHDVLMHCSFCGKPHTTVAKLVAGPGVYICDECVALSANIIDDSAGTGSARSSRPDYPTADILAMLPVLLRSAERVEAELTGWIGRLREQQIEWQAIAAAMGMSVETARLRFDIASPE